MITKEYIVSLKKDVDYDQFWHEIENTSADDALIPSRRVDIVNNRDLSVRSCHYALSDEEADLLRQDLRVAAVAYPADPRVKALSFTQPGNFSRTVGGTDNSWVNWGLRRCILDALEAEIGNQYNYCIDGSGVDIVIQDNGVMSGHPEWQDTNGVSRFIEHNWFTAAGVVGAMPAGHYGDVGNHGTHVAGIAAGKTYGWAKGAQIYSIRYDLFDSEAFDLIKVWHQNKPVNPITGVKRPTIVNASWGFRWFYNNNGGGGVQATRTYRGVTTTSSSTSSATGQITASGGAHNFTYTPADVDQEELTDAGVICVRAAGNYYHKIDQLDGVDWNNNYTYTANWAFGIVPAGNPIYYHRGGSPWSQDTIIVANVDSNSFGSLEQVSVSSERGPGVFLSAPGEDITSATNTTGFIGATSTYPLNSNYNVARISGTSMAAPQITGMLALFLQINPTATAAQCQNWLANVASKNQMSSTGLNNDYTNTRSLMGQTQRFAYFPYAKDTGFSFGGGIQQR